MRVTNSDFIATCAISVFLLFASPGWPSESPVVVKPGMTAEYEHDANNITVLKDIVRGELTVREVNGDQVAFMATAFMRDGRTEITELTVDRKTGMGAGIFAFVIPGLSAGDQVYTLFPEIIVDKVVKQEYGGSRRETLVVNISQAGDAVVYLDRESGLILGMRANFAYLEQDLTDSISAPEIDIESQKIVFYLTKVSIW